jgi:hypothetical protein
LKSERGRPNDDKPAAANAARSPDNTFRGFDIDAFGR